MKFLKYIPTVIFTCIEVGFVVAILENNYRETALLGGLVVLYATLRTTAITTSLSLHKLTLNITSEFLKIKEKIGTEENFEDEWANVKKADGQFSEIGIKSIIRAIGILIIYIIGLVNLL